MLKKLKLLKKPLFQKRRWSCDFPPRKTLVAQKHRAISRQEKMAFSTPVGLSWDFPPPPTESVRTDGRTDVRTDGHVTNNIDLIKPKGGAPLFVLSVFCFCFLFCFFVLFLLEVINL